MMHDHFEHGPGDFGPGGPQNFGPGSFGPGGYGHREYDDFGHWASGVNSNGPWGHWSYHTGIKRTNPKKIRGTLKFLIITIIVIFGIGVLFEILQLIGGLAFLISLWWIVKKPTPLSFNWKNWCWLFIYLPMH